MMDYIGTAKVYLDEGAKMPSRAHSDDAGYDIYARETKCIPAGGSAVFDTGVHIDIAKGFYGEIKSKSGLCVKHDLTATGVIDSGYKGAIVVKLTNHGKDDYIVVAGDKIAQLVISAFAAPALVQVEELSKLGESERGSNGFGSTGR